MATRPKSSEEETLERYRIALENAIAQPEISVLLAELGIDNAEIEEGKSLLTKTYDAYNFNKTEDDETVASKSVFHEKRAEVAGYYSKHRKKAKVIFRKDPVSSHLLLIDEAIPSPYTKWLENVKKFYSELTSKGELITKMARLKVTPEEVETVVALISELETARTVYSREIGESEEATKVKNAAFDAMDSYNFV